MHSGERCLRDGADYRGNIPGPVCVEGLEILTGVVEEPRGNRNGHIVSELPCAQHRLKKSATDPSVAVRERVNCFELSVSDRGLSEQRKVVAAGEGDKIVHELGDSVVMRRQKLCSVGP